MDKNIDVYQIKATLPSLQAALTNLRSEFDLHKHADTSSQSIKTLAGATGVEVPLTFSTGLTRTTNTITVNTSQIITRLAQLTTNGFVKTTGGVGDLTIDTTTYQPATRSVEATTDGSGSPHAVTVAETGKVYTNEGASAKAYHTLPTAAAGLMYTFVVQDSDGIRIVANTDDTIRVAADVSGSAGYTEATTVGNAITLIAINATEWVAISVVGTWTTV